MIGIDEVGRGCWAGPLVVVAYRSRAPLPAKLTDSKKMSKQLRATMLPVIIAAGSVGEGWVWPDEIDRIGLANAMRLGVSRALQVLDLDKNEDIIMDGPINYCDPSFTRVTCVVKADQLHPVVSAASVVAKVARDTYMTQQAIEYPEYGFEKHVGYGTSLHQEKLRTHGPSPLHRLSYKPVKLYL